MSAGIVLSVESGCYGDFVTVAAVFLCLLLACFVRNSALFHGMMILTFFAWGTFCLSPWLAPDCPADLVVNAASHTPHVLEGVICSRPVASTDGSRMAVRLEMSINGAHAQPVSGTILLFAPENDVPLQRGDRIRFTAKVSLPRRLGLPGEFAYDRYLALQGIVATCRVSSWHDIVSIRAAAEPSWQRTFDVVAESLSGQIRRSISDEKVSTVLTALLIGDQRRIPDDLNAAYSRAGVNHILSISGFHVGIIAACMTVAVVWFLTRFEYLALHWNIRRVVPLFAVPLMIAYLALTGTAPATARSVIMLSVCAVALYSEREREPLNTLLFAAFFLVVINPPTLFDVSFQLSFLSLWGILLALPPVMTYTALITHRWLRLITQCAAISCAASCATVLPVLFVFKTATFNGILTNFLIVPLLGYGAVIAGFIVLPLVALFPQFTALLLWPAATLVAVANKGIIWCSALPVITYHGVGSRDMALFLLAMAALTFMRKRHWRVMSVVVIAVIGLSTHMYRLTARDGLLHITMLSVGQAESLLVTLPDGSHLLVDGGGYLHDTGHDFGQRVLAPALGALQVRRIERMIMTHDHPDHSGGLPFILEHFPVEQFWSTSIPPTALLTRLSAQRTMRQLLVAGDRITLPNGVELQVLSPHRLPGTVKDLEESDVNEQSLVFRLNYGSFSMIFCADAGFEAEQQIIASGMLLPATVLKVGHHGSRYSTSEAFLRQVDPKIALISAGYGNRFGLPSARTLDLLKNSRIAVYRTDRDGTIDVATNGTSWSVSTPFKPE
jgi:competence protein ComEC